MNTSRAFLIITAVRRCALALLLALLLYASPVAPGLGAALNNDTASAQTAGVAAAHHSLAAATDHPSPASAPAAGCTLTASGPQVPALPDVVRGYTLTLTGSAESPPNASPATGSGYVSIDTVNQAMSVYVTFSGLVGTTTAAHIHSPTTVPGAGNAGVATTTPTFAAFPPGVTSGTYSIGLDMTQTSSYNPAFVTANGGTAASAFAALCAGIDAGKAYFNIHTNTFTGGEIRGFLVATFKPRLYLPLVLR